MDTPRSDRLFPGLPAARPSIASSSRWTSSEGGKFKSRGETPLRGFQGSGCSFEASRAHGVKGRRGRIVRLQAPTVVGVLDRIARERLASSVRTIWPRLTHDVVVAA